MALKCSTRLYPRVSALRSSHGCCLSGCKLCPVISSASNHYSLKHTHSLSLACMFSSALLLAFHSYSLLPDFFSHAHTFPRDGSGAWENKASLTTSHYTTNKSIFRFLPAKLFIHGRSSSQLAWILFIQRQLILMPGSSDINVLSQPLASRRMRNSLV